MKFTRKEIFSIPNLMGYARILLIPAFIVTYLDGARNHCILPSIILLCSALLDFFDGIIARKYHMVTDLGKMLDPIADKLTHGSVAFVLIFRYPFMLPLLILMLIKELYMAVHGYLHLKRGGAVYGAMRIGKICTATHFICFLILAFFVSIPLLYANLLILLCAIVTLLTLILYIRHFRRERQGEKKHTVPKTVRRITQVLLLSLLALFLFLGVGAVSPFVRYKNVTNETVSSFDASRAFEHCAKGERVRLIEDNEDALRERIRLFGEAKERIILSTFDVRDGDAFRDMATVLLERADDGVSVKILIDGFNFALHMSGTDILDALAMHPSVEIRVYNELSLLTPWTSQGRMHDKYVIADDFAYLIGGRNTFDYFLTDHENASHDRELLVYETSPTGSNSLTDLTAYFESVWNADVTSVYHGESSSGAISLTESLRARYDALRNGKYADCFLPRDSMQSTYETEGILLLANPTHIYGKEPILFYKLTEMMKEAKQSVRIHTPYAVLNGYMEKRLTQVTERVPHVSMMLNGVENGDNLVASSDYLYNKDRILDSGIRLLEYQGGHSYHAKTVLIDDDISIVGSFNFDLRSTYLDTELMIAVKCKKLNEELSAVFDDFEASACEQSANGEETVPPGVSVRELSLGENLLYQTIGLLLYPFRYLV